MDNNNNLTCQTEKRGFLLMLSWVFVSLMILLSATDVFSNEPGQREVTASELDYALRDALNARDYEKFEYYLSRGADPTVWFENTRRGWVYCATTEPGLEAYLQLIIENGFDVNFRQTDIHTTSSLLLTCAVVFDNLRAMKMLVAAGADPAAKMCVACNRRMPLSALAEAALVNKYRLAIWLVDKGNYSEAQMQTVISGLEIFPFDEKNPRNALRLELAERIREQGYEVNPWTKDKR